MDWKNIEFYPDFWIDLVMIAVVTALLVVLSKCLWDLKEGRRLKKEMKNYQLMKEDEE